MNKLKKIIVERGKCWDFDSLPEYSVALDGAVRGPVFDSLHKRYSFDHHENSIRHITSATCVQVMEAIMLGFDPSGYSVYINDIDGDTVLSCFLLANPDLLQTKFLVKLVHIAGKIDALGPAYPLFKEERDLYHTFNKKVMNKYFQLKEEGAYQEYNLEKLLYDCMEKLSLWLKDPVIEGYQEPDTNPVLHPPTGNDLWIMAQGDFFAFRKLYESGFTRIVIWQKLKNGSYSYTIAKKSEFVEWDIPAILSGLNKIETGWGGASTIGGSPRNRDGTRSKIEPEELVEYINRLIS